MRQTSQLALTALLVGSLFTSTVRAAEGEEETDGGRTNFVYGGECGQLSQLSRHEIQAVTHAVHTDNFGRFCYVQGIYSCSDYSALLRGAGSLEENDSFGCTFVPATR